MNEKLRLALTVILALVVVAVLVGCPKSATTTSATPEVEPRVQASGDEQPSATAETPAQTETGEQAEAPEGSEATEAAESPSEEAQEAPATTSGGSTEPIKLTDADFTEKIEDAKATGIVDFWAVWCPPCRQQGPVVEKIAKKYGDKILVGKVNVDEAEEVARKFNIEAIPTLILFRDGKEVDRLVGLRDEAELSRAIESKLLQ